MGGTTTAMKSRFGVCLSGAVFTGLLLLAPVAAPSQDSSGQHMDQGASKMMKSADTHFAMQAAQGGIAEVKLGQLAAEKAANPDVKAFGQQMVDDHTKANDQLKSIAQGEGMTLPTDVNAKQQAMYNKLSKLSGAEFDRQYVKGMVADHEEDVKEFQKEANNGKDEKIKSFASQTLPVLQQHLDKIKSIQSKMGSGSSM
jgi:putative membrane protein